MKINYRRNSFLPLAAALALLVNHATAATWTWIGANNTTWEAGTNWFEGTIPAAANTTELIFSTANQSFIRNDRTIKSLTFTDSSDGQAQIALSQSFTAGAASRSLTFNSDSGNATLTVASGSTGDKFILRTGTLFSNVNLTSSLDIVHNGSGTLNFGGQTIITGAGGINKSGTGTLSLQGSNTYLGATAVNAGTLSLDHATNTLSSSSAVTVDGATAILSIGANSDTVGAVSLKNGGSITGTGGTLTGASYAVESGSVSAILGGAGIALTKSTTGTVTLTGANTYTGDTTITSGTLEVNGSLTGSASTVGNTGILKGSGSITGAVAVQSGGTLAAGSSIESLATGALTFDGGSTFGYELNNDAAPGVAGDLTAVTGTFTLAVANTTNITFTELGAGAWSAGEKLTLASYSGTWNGGLFNFGSVVADDSTISFGGTDWTFNYNDTVAGSNFTSDLTGTNYVTITAVPEPGAVMSLLAGMGVLALVRRRRA